MGSGRGTDSHLASIAKRRATVMASRKRLNMDADRGAAQAPVRQNPPPQTLPARNPPQAEEPAGDMRQRMLSQTEEFFQRAVNPQAVPIADARAGRGEVQGPPPTPVPTSSITEQTSQLGASGLSPEQQFYRLTSRLPSPRELAVFRTTLYLEQQLGRRPTGNELKAALSRPQVISAAVPSAVEA